ncbi:MAG TPA: AAA family ATPase [Terracidiphilus sp.]|nr:AAA family ATPase [Terracidiphilus sp.]
MFDSVEQLTRKLAAIGYFIDPVMIQVVYLAAKLQKPLLLEGPAGSGKTQLAISVAAAAGTHVERLQCFRGVTEDKAIGRFDEGLQRLYMEFSRGQHENWQAVQANFKGRDFFRPGPLLRALECEQPCVLLIDEIDKVDEGFEAQAFKRAASCFGLGRYLYNFTEMWVPLNEHRQPTRFPTLPRWALAKTPSNGKAHPVSGPRPPISQRGPIDQEVMVKIEGFRRILGAAIYGEILWRAGHARRANDIPNAQFQANVAEAMERAARGVHKAYSLAEQIGEATFIAVMDKLQIESMTKIPRLESLKALVTELAEEAARSVA